MDQYSNTRDITLPLMSDDIIEGTTKAGFDKLSSSWATGLQRLHTESTRTPTDQVDPFLMSSTYCWCHVCWQRRQHWIRTRFYDASSLGWVWQSNANERMLTWDSKNSGYVFQGHTTSNVLKRLTNTFVVLQMKRVTDVASCLFSQCSFTRWRRLVTIWQS